MVVHNDVMLKNDDDKCDDNIFTREASRMVMTCAHHLFYPSSVGVHPCINARDIPSATPDAERNYADLVPMSLLLAHQGTAAITLKKSPKLKKKCKK